MNFVLSDKTQMISALIDGYWIVGIKLEDGFKLGKIQCDSIRELTETEKIETINHTYEIVYGGEKHTYGINNKMPTSFRPTKTAKRIWKKLCSKPEFEMVKMEDIGSILTKIGIKE